MCALFDFIIYGLAAGQHDERGHHLAANVRFKAAARIGNILVEPFHKRFRPAGELRHLRYYLRGHKRLAHDWGKRVLLQRAGGFLWQNYLVEIFFGQSRDIVAERFQFRSLFRNLGHGGAFSFQLMRCDGTATGGNEFEFVGIFHLRPLHIGKCLFGRFKPRLYGIALYQHISHLKRHP